MNFISKKQVMLYSRQMRDEAIKWDPKSLSKKWNKKWKEGRVYQSDLDTAKNPFYSLYMFPYPSAEGLHVGHAFSGTGADVYSRFKRMQGLDVFHPMGFDAFGIHSENFALKIGDHPRNLIDRATKNFKEQFDSLGFSYDWDHSVNTSSVEYYKWTQWIFTTLFKAGLVEKKKAPVNWCPSCKTVLADEQVLQKSKIIHSTSSGQENQKSKIGDPEAEDRVGVCERCGTEVETRDLEQWFFKITHYADRLLSDLETIDWTPKVKLAQKNWIGKSEGLLFTAPVKDTKLHIDTFSAHFEAFRADTFVVIAPDHPVLSKLIEEVPNKKEIESFASKLVEKRRDEKPGQEKEPEGIFTGRYIEDPVGNGDLPIWVANYALKDYGTGIVKCSAHDVRDFAFAKKYGIRLKPVLFPEDKEMRKKIENLEVCYTDMVNGILSEPSEFEGKKAGKVRTQIMEYIEKKGLGKRVTNYHLRDWLISRQRYWGAPIPMIYCEKCAEAGKSYFDTPKDGVPIISKPNHQSSMPGWFPVPDEDLPVKLPFIENFKPLGTGESPLAQDKDFVNVKCPNCGSQARRETDVADTFLDSSWYFLRYPVANYDSIPFPSLAWKSQAPKPKSQKGIENWELEIENSAKRTKWLPVNMYIGGAEHSVLHLLYARFVTKALFDLKLLDFAEPFTRFRAHGLIIKEGAKMSKSKGNVVNPDEYIAKYGADAIRLYLMFLGPFDQGGDFRDSGMEGMARFVKRFSKFLYQQLELPSAAVLETKELDRIMNKTIKLVTSDLETLSYNTAIARIMEYVNALTKAGLSKRLDNKYLRSLLLTLAPFAPYMSEELFELMGESSSIHKSAWPSYDEDAMSEDTVVVAVQVNGRLRDTLSLSKDIVNDEKQVEKLARESQKVAGHLVDVKIVKTIYIEGKVLNFVVT